MKMTAEEKNQQLYKPWSNGKKESWCNIYQARRDSDAHPTPLPCPKKGIIAKEASLSLQQGIQGFRGPSNCRSGFQVADIFYFCRSGVESIVDDEVTKRFSAQELESWNLLTRSRCHFRHVGPQLTVLWALGILIRYGVLLPLRSER